MTKETQVPIWLLNACSALDYITSEHPKAMSIISAILITAGSIPAIPAIAAGAGGAVLASGAVQAAGAIAIGLGQALNTTVKKAQKQQDETPMVRWGHGNCCICSRWLGDYLSVLLYIYIHIFPTFLFDFLLQFGIYFHNHDIGDVGEKNSNRLEAWSLKMDSLVSGASRLPEVVV